MAFIRRVVLLALSMWCFVALLEARCEIPAADTIGRKIQHAAAASAESVNDTSVRRTGDNLQVTVTEMAPNVFRFDIRASTATGFVFSTTSRRVRLEKDDAAIRVEAGKGRAWRGKVLRLPEFGRARVPGLELSWLTWPDEAIYGLGERFGRLNQAGRVVEMWIADVPGQEGADAPSYYVAPVLYGTRGYVLFATDNPEGIFDLNSRGDGVNRYRRAGDRLTFYLAFGRSLKELVAKRASVQGPYATIPDWAWGPWISRNSYETQAEAEAAIRGMIERGIPVAAIVQEAWKGPSETGRFNDFDAGRWPDLEGYFALCARHRIRTILWQVPIVHPSSPEFAEGERNGYFVKKPDGSISFRRQWLEGFANVDFTNPDAVKYFQNLMRAAVRKGVAGFKADDGEDIKPDDVFSDGRRGWEMHNEYSTLYNRALAELLRQEGVDGMLWARSGSLGNERYPGLWAGDQYARWDQMASLVPAGLSAGMSGMPFWGHDIGGYIGQPTPELYIRWSQFGALSPLMQYHGIQPREPWMFGAEAEAAYKLLANLRMNLVPTLIELGHEAAQTGWPIMRPMLMEFPDDPRFVHEDTQYMLGPDLLVAPVLTENATGRRIKFPKGMWQHALLPVAYTGPSEVEVPIDFCDAPLFVREGATLKLQLREGAPLGEWDRGAPVRNVTFGPGRAVLCDVIAPLAADISEPRVALSFELTGRVPPGLRIYWQMDNSTTKPTPVVWKARQGKVEADLTPPSDMVFAGRIQRYVIEDPAGRLLWQGAIRWR